jgi:FkbM family methyltransferase
MTMPERSASYLRRRAGRLIRAAQSHLTTNPDRFLKTCSSVVHVGANTGQERELYDRYGLAVTWIEPIPAVYQELVQNIRSYPKQVAIQALLSDRPGETLNLNVANNSGASSSIFDLALHRDIWPDVYYTGCLQMQTETLDGLLERGIVRLPIDAVVLDTQGSELMVLQGSEGVLPQTNYIKVEAADFEAYKGGATVETIEEFLKKRCFRLTKKTKFAEHPAGGRYYDLLFKRAL